MKSKTKGGTGGKGGGGKKFLCPVRKRTRGKKVKTPMPEPLRTDDPGSWTYPLPGKIGKTYGKNDKEQNLGVGVLEK